MKTRLTIILFCALALLIFALPSSTLAATVTLSWGANTEPDLAGYKVYYGTSPRTGACPPGGYPLSVNAGNATTYTISGLANSQTYYFSISAYDTTGNESCFSSEIIQATPPSPLKVSVTSPASAATVSGSAVTVSASASDTVGVAGVQFKLDGVNLGAEDISSPYSITWNTTLTANGAHVLMAAARNTAGNQATSSAVIIAVNNVSATCGDATSPSVPANLTASAISSSQINLSWTASTDNIGVAGYKVYRCQGTGCAPVLLTTLGNVTSYSNTGLSASTVYAYAVSAYDASGNISGRSLYVSATTLSSTAPAPTSTSTTGLPKVITFTTPFPYTITRGSSIQIQWEVSNADSVTITPSVGGEPLPLKGSRTIQPQVTTTYVLTATNVVGTVTRKATEIVTQP